MINRDRVEKEAADWLVCEDRGFDLREQTAFESWLAHDLGHRVSYLRLKAIWRKADQLSTRAGSIPQSRTPVARCFGIVTPERVRWAARAAVLLLVAGLFGLWVLRPQDQTIVTAAARGHSLTLSDGSRIALGGNASLKAVQTESGHAVTLNHGTARFDAAYGKAHPFVVYAGDRKITGRGAKFSVSHSGDGIEVVVERGRVHVDALGNVTTAPVALE